MLNSPECPLTGDSLERAKCNFVFVQARGVYRHLKHRRFASALAIVRHAGPSAGDLDSLPAAAAVERGGEHPPSLHEVQT